LRGNDDRRDGYVLFLVEAWLLVVMATGIGPWAWFMCSAGVGTAITMAASHLLHDGFARLIQREFSKPFKHDRQLVLRLPPTPPAPHRRVLLIPLVVGLFERSALTLAIYFVARNQTHSTALAADAIKSIGPGAVAWVALKMAAGWHKGDLKGATEGQLAMARAQGLAGVLGSLVSLGCAVVAGVLMAQEG
jgi:hypothetical protein